MSDGAQRQQFEDLREAVRGRLSMAELCAKEDIKGHREGTAFRAVCPFHTETSGSFLIGGRAPDRAHCFGCGWDGDIYAFWTEYKGVTHVEAVNQLASLVGLTPIIPGVAWTKPKAKGMTPVTGNRRYEKGEKPALPKLVALTDAQIEQLATLRGLSPASVAVAARVFKRVGYGVWPLMLNRLQRRWMSPCETHWFKCKLDQPDCKAIERFPAWVVTDESRWVAQFRRMDGEKYIPKLPRKPFKGWTQGTATWPIGCAEMGNRMAVLLVEGGADMLACYHFLLHFKMLDYVAVCCMLGAGGRIAEVALPYFKGKRVRIIADADEVKDDGKRPGIEAAWRWQEQLREAGATVKVFDLSGLVRKDGELVKDTNDLAYCEPEVWQNWPVSDAFTEWKEGFGD